MNLLFQNALKGTSQKVPPIWMMRQAGRYHGHYQKLRAKNSFEDLCRVPELAAEVAMGPIEDFDFDVAILFSDLLFPLDGMGMELVYTEKGPRLMKTLEEIEQFHQFNAEQIEKAIEDLKFQGQAMKLTRSRLPQNKSLIGFVGGPWTLYVYAREGSHAGSLTQSKAQYFKWKKFIQALETVLEKNIQNQFDNGAEVVMIFDTAAGELSPLLFKDWVYPFLKKLTEKFPDKLGYYTKNIMSSFYDHDFYNLKWAGMGFDHHENMVQILKQRKSGFRQGNFDQSLLFLEPEQFAKTLDQYLQPILALSEAERAGWVCGLGHGVLPKTPNENVRKFIQTVREKFSKI